MTQDDLVASALSKGVVKLTAILDDEKSTPRAQIIAARTLTQLFRCTRELDEQRLTLAALEELRQRVEELTAGD